jgi:hypothetical protein
MEKCHHLLFNGLFAPQEALKRPMKQKRKLRIFISNTFYPAKEPSEGEEGSVASWELRVEGRLLEDSKNDPNKVCMYSCITALQPRMVLASSAISFHCSFLHTHVFQLLIFMI